MLSEQVLVFFLYFAWFAGPFIAVEYVKDRKMAQGRYVQLILAGCGAILIVSAALFFVTPNSVIPIWLVLTMNWVAFCSAQRLNDFGVPKSRTLWILTGIGLIGVPWYCLSVSRRAV